MCYCIIDDMATCDAGWTSYRGSCYKLVVEPETWENASHLCYQSGSHLTSILSDWEENFITHWLKSIKLLIATKTSIHAIKFVSESGFLV